MSAGVLSSREVVRLLRYLTPTERVEVDAIVRDDLEKNMWQPLPGPQLMADESLADIVGFGGAAGGGKTDLACGKLRKHRKAMILRRESTQLQGIIDRLTQLFGDTTGYNSQKNVWRPPGRNLQIEFGSTPHAGDENKYQGRDHDYLVFDEAVNFLESQVRFLLGWLRTTTPGQHKQALLTFNPPTEPEGRWIIPFFAPWLDDKYPNPAEHGELRWCAQLPGTNGTSRDLWVKGPEPFVLTGGEPVYEFDEDDYPLEDIIYPMSRTFIPSRVTDNPYLIGTGYMRQLQAMPEPLRSQMLYGDFKAGMTADPWQVIPTAWVEAAQARWKDRSPKGEMMGVGVDVARGGKDKTVIARKHVGLWFDRLLKYPGKETPDGQEVVGLMIAATRSQAPCMIDVIGVGASPYDLARAARQDVHGINVSEKSTKTDRSGRLTFFNKRSEYWWAVRELLDPDYDTGMALPPDPEVLADLCAPRWELRGMTIQVESRDAIIDRIHRSPDCASAIILAAIPMPKISDLAVGGGAEAVMRYNPMQYVHSPESRQSGPSDESSLEYDPFSHRM